MTNKKIVFAPSDKIGENSYKLIERLFGIRGAFLTNESTLFDFDPVDEIPGHELRKLSEIPEPEREFYLEEESTFINPKKYSVWYPKVRDEEWEEIHKNSRRRLLALVEIIYGVSMEDFPDDKLYVWKVAEFVKSKKLN